MENANNRLVEYIFLLTFICVPLSLENVSWSESTQEMASVMERLLEEQGI